MLATRLRNPSAAEADPTPGLEVFGTCPTRDAVIAVIADTVQINRLGVPGMPGTHIVVTSDEGATYRVDLFGTIRTYSDWPAHCDERARTVALVVALALAPPVIEADQRRVETTERVSESQVEFQSKQITTGRGIQFETGVFFEAAPFNASAASAGADLRLAIGRTSYKFVIGGTVAAPFLVSVTGGSVRVHRVPLDLALRVHLGGELIAAVVDLGPRFTIQRSEGADIMNGVHAVRLLPMKSVQAMRLETGARVAAHLDLRLRQRYGAYLAVQGEYVPWPSRFETSDFNMLGEMPSLWVGASMGLVVNMN
jgi:hypothetical protein